MLLWLPSKWPTGSPRCCFQAAHLPAPRLCPLQLHQLLWLTAAPAPALPRLPGGQAAGQAHPQARSAQPPWLPPLSCRLPRLPAALLPCLLAALGRQLLAAPA